MKIILVLMSLLMTVNIMAQRRLSIEYSDEKVIKCAVEIYQKSTQYLTLGHLQSYKEYLTHFEFYEATNEQIATGNYPLISTLTLRNKYNVDLDYDKGPNFDIEKFNPLKYFFLTDENGMSPFYKIYGTNYLVRYNAK